VIAFAVVTIVIPADRFGYEGRSHSLYFCDARTQGEYGWFETAFMVSPLMARVSSQDPFALPPGEPAAKALSMAMTEYQVAWPFTELIAGETEEFVDRWVGWFAAGVEGRLARPSTMPERRADGSWRRS
jgi:serine/threonine-protein kinase